MINFQSLELRVDEIYSFVGIKKQNHRLFFYLPKGFKNQLPALDTFASKRDLFFLFYKILNTFKEICIEKGYLEDETNFSTQDRDGVINSACGSEIQKDEDDSENIFYSKLDIIGHLLNAYDEPKILALAYRLGKSDKFDVSQIHRYLHQAVYLHNNAAYVDQMLLPRREVQFESTDIVTMYCYLFYEIKQQLGEVVSAEITALAERFKQHYLSSGDSLFQEQYYEQVLDILKDVLERIDHNTPIKDADYWQYYEALELFLYGDWQKAENGEIWGIKNFHSVWESMCLTYVAKRAAPERILQLDTKFLSDDVVALANSQPKILDLVNVFRINGSQLVPDAVILSTEFNSIRNKEKNTFLLNKSCHDDFGYKTRFLCEVPNSSEKEGVRIAYRGQPTETHTFSKLEELKLDKVQSEQLIINRQLPSKFYSFWDIDINKLDDQVLDMMFQFNHIFYVALRKFIYTPNQFSKFLNEIIGNNEVIDNNETIIKNVFTRSLFRDFLIGNHDTSYLVEMFKNFLDKVLDKVGVLTVIDIKYFPQEYFLDINNCRYLKEESVRKQFVYEYLLQQFIKKSDNCKSWEIKSRFWLPSWRDNSSVIEKVEPEYLNGYIELQNINFAVIADSYID